MSEQPPLLATHQDLDTLRQEADDALDQTRRALRRALREAEHWRHLARNLLPEAHAVLTTAREWRHRAVVDDGLVAAIDRWESAIRRANTNGREVGGDE